jgi:hypothetical protein
LAKHGLRRARLRKRASDRETPFKAEKGSGGGLIPKSGRFLPLLVRSGPKKPVFAALCASSAPLFSSSVLVLPHVPWGVPEAAPFVSYGSIVDVSFLSATHGRVLRFVPGMATTAAASGHLGGPSLVREFAACRSSRVGTGFEVCRRRRGAGGPDGNADRLERPRVGISSRPVAAAWLTLSNSGCCSRRRPAPRVW